MSTITATNAEVDAAIAKHANLSPTARMKAVISEARDAAMRAAGEAEGTEFESAADAAFRAIDIAYGVAVDNHRIACEEYAKLNGR